LIWMPGRHIHADTATVRQLSEIVLRVVRETRRRRPCVRLLSSSRPARARQAPASSSADRCGD
jgi:hypothetical protein